MRVTGTILKARGIWRSMRTSMDPEIAQRDATSSDDRFGVSEELIQRLQAPYRALGRGRVGAYVPTQGEVRTRPAEELIPILRDWFWEGPFELIPTGDQVAHVIQLLRARPDAHQFSRFIQSCEPLQRAWANL